MAEHDAREQYLLELTNRARMDPAGEAARHGVDLNAGLAPGTITAAPKQVLAPNSILEGTAQAHADYLVANQLFTHTGAGGSTSNDRMRAAGYNVPFTSENIVFWGTTGVLDVTATTNELHRLWFASSGHRSAMLNSTFEELGVGNVLVNGGAGYRGATNALLAVQNFGHLNTPDKFVTGVHYNDTDNNDFYSMGEGKGTRTVQLIQNGSVISASSTAAAGGYAAKTTATGAVEVVFSGGGLAASQGVTINLGASNVKVDLVDSNTIETNTDATLTQSTQNLRLIGIENINGTGNAAGNTIWGNKGNNVLDGAGGNDTLQGGDGTDTLNAGAGNDSINGGAGTDTVVLAANAASYTITYNAPTLTYSIYGADGSVDTVTGVENFQFSDVTRTAAQLTISGAPPVRTASVAASSPTVVEGNSGTTAFTFVVTLNAAPHANQTVTYTVAGTGVNAANANDFSGSLTGSVTFAAGETRKVITVLIAGDIVAELNETFVVTLSAPSSGLTLGTNTATATITNDDSSEILGTIGNDALNGTVANDSLRGLEGNDTLSGGLGADVLDGGIGADTARYSSSDAFVNINMLTGVYTGGHAQGDTFTDVESIIGSSFNDIIRGNSSANTLSGTGGNDELYGEAGVDTLVGGVGADKLDGGAGTADYAYYSSSTSAVTVNLLTNINTGGDAAGDQLFNIERVFGSAHDDILTGNGLANLLSGSGGNDTLTGGAGTDTLTGGVGNDTFMFNTGFGADTVTDWQDGAEKIRFDAAMALDFGALAFAGQGTKTVVVSGFADGSIITVKSAAFFTLEAGDFLFA